jgi:hypothetical protein
VKKETIETLIELTKTKIKEIEFSITGLKYDIKVLKSTIHSKLVKLHKDRLISDELELEHLNFCLSDLQKLKEFETQLEDSLRNEHDLKAIIKSFEDIVLEKNETIENLENDIAAMQVDYARLENIMDNKEKE